MTMGEFAALLSDLGQTCQQLERIKAEQVKEHDLISMSFEKTLLSILRQEQRIFNRVEEEHGRLREQLSSIQRSNDQALQEGVSEINHVVHEISTISSQLKEALDTSNDECVIKEIQERVSNVFERKKSINIRLRKVHFSPHPLVSTTIGDICSEEHTLGFSIPCVNRKESSRWIKNDNPVLLSDEKPPWEQNSEAPGLVAVKLVLEDGSDPDTGSRTSSSSSGTGKGTDLIEQKSTFSPRERAIEEADTAALSPRTATKKWISDIKPDPDDGKKPEKCGDGNLRNVSAEESGKATRPRFTATKHIPKGFPEIKTSNRFVKCSRLNREDTKEPISHTGPSEDPRVLQPSQQITNSLTPEKRRYSHVSRNGALNRKNAEHQSPKPNQKADIPHAEKKDAEEAVAQRGIKRWSTFSKKSASETSKDQTSCLVKTTITNAGDGPVVLEDRNTLFKATAAYVCEDDSDVLEEEERGVEEDPKACRELVIRDSRVPSAKKFGDGDQVTTRLPMETHCLDESSEKKHDLMDPSFAVDYMRMSEEPSENMFNQPPRPVSPSGSVTSSYTFIIDFPASREAGQKSPRPFSQPKGKTRAKGLPVISSPVQNDEVKPSRQVLRPKELTQDRTSRRLSSSRDTALNEANQTPQPASLWRSVPRSYSMPYIERISRQVSSPSRSLRPASSTDRKDSVSSSSSCRSNPRSLGSSRVHGKSFQNTRKRGQVAHRFSKQTKCLSKSESNLIDFPLKAEGPDGFVKQFGKFGSGRAELNLPHGVQSTTSGALYIVDYGNRRLQVMDTKGKVLQQIVLQAKNYFDVAVSNRGLIALTNSTDRTVEVYNKHGRFLQTISRNWGAPRGITANHRDEFIVTDMRQGTLYALTLDSTTGRQKESTIVPGFNKPYLVDSNSQGLLAVSERGFDGGCCVKVLRNNWQVLKVLGLRDSPGHTLYNPWGVCIDEEGGVLVADWGQKHSIIYFPPSKPAQCIVSEGLSSPRGLAVGQDRLLMVADSMHNCIKIFQYQDPGP